MRALERKLVRDLWRMRGQLVAAALVMACGIATLTMSRSTVASLETARDTFYQRYRFPHVFAHVRRAPTALLPRIADIPGIAQARPRIVVEVNLDIPDFHEPATARLISIPERPPFGLSELHVTRGRLPEPGRGSEVVVSETFAEAHDLHPGATVYAVINGRRQALTVVGFVLSPEFVYQVRPGDVLPDNLRYGVFFMPDRELAAAFDLDGAFNDIVVSLTPDASEAEVIARLDDLLTPWGGQGAHGRRDQPSDRYIRDELSQLRTMSIIPPGIFLSAAAFILNIIFSRLVRSQREQIAALKAFGYGRWAIATHYLGMALVMSLLGSAVGIVAGWRLGVAMTEMYGRFYRFPVFDFEFDRTGLVIAVVVAMGAAAAGTIGAVRSAATLPPAQAMRPEAPPDYRATLSERIGLRHLFGPAGRMVVRHLERRPLRAVLSTLGMSLAVAVLIVGSFMTGAIHYLVDFMFFTTQRQDMTVALVEPGTPGTMHAIAQLPGVISAEPFRAVPARLRAGGRSRLQGVMGLPAQPRLNRVVDADEHPVAMPPDGLLLSDGLARALDVGAGDRVIVEVLDGRRPTVELTVTGIAQTYAGTAAYMDIVALNRLMREGPVVSGAALDVDPRLAAALYHTLKQTPAVASVTLKRAALDSFNETLAENLLRMRLFNVVFAVIIAFGVVYNSARISLAERAHELATMRVLGFTRAEVSSVLLGELAVLTILAIPVGMVLGSGLARLVTTLMSGENISMPFIISPGTYAFAGIVIILAALVSGLVVRRGVDHLDLVEVLKTKG